MKKVFQKIKECKKVMQQWIKWKAEILWRKQKKRQEKQENKKETDRKRERGRGVRNREKRSI